MILEFFKNLSAFKACKKAFNPEAQATTATQGPTSTQDDPPADSLCSRKSRAFQSMKCGRGRRPNNIVQTKLDWPHYHVCGGHNAQAARYEDLTIKEFFYGYLCSMYHTKTMADTKTHMQAHLQNLKLKEFSMGYYSPI